MKLETITIADVATSKFGGNEAKGVRTDRMRKFWTDPRNATLFVVGRLLASPSGGKSLAQHLIDGSEIELNHIVSNGQSLPLAPGFKLSLASIASWGCLACGSAHGSGVYPSKKINLDLLEACKFYYNPGTRQLFTISNDCWGSYVKALGAATPARFVAAHKIEVPKPVHQIEAPKPVHQIEAPKPVHQIEAPKPVHQIEAPKPVTQSGGAKK